MNTPPTAAAIKLPVRCGLGRIIDADNTTVALDCGYSEQIVTALNNYDAMRTALEQIAAYPVHSEPVGGALAMHDIAKAALEQKR